MAEFGWTRRDFRLVARKPALSDGMELCDGSYDALVYVIGPTGRITYALGPDPDAITAAVAGLLPARSTW